MNKTTQSHLPSSGAGSAIPTSPSATDQEVLVRVEGVSKKFCRSLKKSLWYGLCDIGGELSPFGRQARGDRPEATGDGGEAGLRDGEFWAVNDVSFELRRGVCLGLIGNNGAGKTTLLKMLKGLIKPDSGKITMRGRVGALIALGAGFNPILTGRENIYINGSVLGLSKKEIDEKIDEIIDFAEIGEFIDSPVQNYSSGMSVRLGFSIASSLSPDVLILDEVLAVGDIGFVIKCLNRVRKLTANAAVILVSHQMQFVSQFCSRVLFMEDGHAELDASEPKEAIDRYFALVRHEQQLAGLGTVEIDKVGIRGVDPDGKPSSEFLAQGCPAFVDLNFTVREPSEAAKVNVSIDDESGSQVITCPVVDENGRYLEFRQGTHRLHLDLGKIELNSGKYSVLVGARGAVSDSILVRSQGNCPFRVAAPMNLWSKIVRPVRPRLVPGESLTSA